MEKKDLIELKKELNKLSDEEKRERDLYLRGLANGELQGPPVGYASIDKPWLKWYKEEDMSSTVPKCSIYDNMCKQTEKYGNMTALEFGGRKITYNEFKEKIDKVAKMLVSYGVKEGDVVSVCLPNIPEVGYIFYAINKIGAVANMLDPRTNESTLVSNVNDTNSNVLLTMDTVCEKFLKTNVSHIISVPVLNSLPTILQKIVKLKDKSLSVELPDDDRIIQYKSAIKNGKKIKHDVNSVYKENAPAVIAYTGGTTGMPKGVIETNEAFNAMIVENKFGDYNVSCGDKCINIAPPWTYYGLSNCFNAYLCMGVDSILIPALGPDDLGKLIHKYKPNHVITVPSALIAVMKEKQLEKENLDYLKTIIVGADKLDPTFEEEFNEFLKSKKSPALVTKGYGMTEVCAAATYTKNGTNDSGTVGVPYIFENVSIFDIENGDECLINEQGEIAINGPKNMVGYFGSNKDKTKEVLKEHEDGSLWAHTGDIGHIDSDGKLYIDGRLKRMFVKNGFKIFPGEIEEQILKCDKVEQAAVISVEDETNGFIAKAYVVLKDGVLDNNDSIIDTINNNLKNTLYDYEIPDTIDIIEKMPLTGMNKIDYRALEKLSKNNKCKKLTKNG